MMITSPVLKIEIDHMEGILSLSIVCAKRLGLDEAKKKRPKRSNLTEDQTKKKYEKTGRYMTEMSLVETTLDVTAIFPHEM